MSNAPLPFARPPVVPNNTRALLHRQPACEQRCGADATVYAMFPGGAGDWGGRYCEPCADRLGFVVTDRLRRCIEARRDD